MQCKLDFNSIALSIFNVKYNENKGDGNGMLSNKPDDLIKFVVEIVFL